jgi:hypothetical protein
MSCAVVADVRRVARATELVLAGGLEDVGLGLGQGLGTAKGGPLRIFGAGATLPLCMDKPATPNMMLHLLLPQTGLLFFLAVMTLPPG